MGFLELIKKSSLVHIFLGISFCTSGIIINVIQAILYLFLWPTYKDFYRKINYYLCYSIYSQLSFLGDWWSETDLSIYIDEDDFEKYYGKEHGLVLMNHSYEVDWLINWMFCDRIQVLGNCKVYAKKTLEYLPVLGWSMKFGEGVFLERNWDYDKEIIGRQISQLAEYSDPMWLLLFAEGTRFTPTKHEASEKFAREKGLPVLKYHLTPRTKGFIESIAHLRGKNAAIYDVQVAFDPDEKIKPTLLNLLEGKKLYAHCYIKRIPLCEVPESDEAAATWLHKQYQEKDRVAESFNETGDFFATSGVKKIKMFKIERRCYSMINTLSWAVIVAVPMFSIFIILVLYGSTFFLLFPLGFMVFSYVMLKKAIAMSEVSKTSSSYGTTEKNKLNLTRTQ